MTDYPDMEAKMRLLSETLTDHFGKAAVDKALLDYALRLRAFYADREDGGHRALTLVELMKD